MERKAESMTKPDYKVPSMEEIRAIPWNGFNVISTFSGAGGSSTGYKMAGFRVLWANEFIEAARETYKANYPDTIVNGEDIRNLSPETILSEIRLERGELDLLDGSPPCASFSTAGKRQKGWGKERHYSDSHQRVDDLFFEFARILKGIQPRVFVAENVSGLIRGTAIGYFKAIFSELSACGYRVKAKLLNAQWLGVPQMRTRVIFVGVRSDLGLEPVHPDPLPYYYTVAEVLPWIRGLRLTGRPNNWKSSDRPAGTVLASDGRRPEKSSAYFSAYEVEAETDISRYAIGREWDNVAIGKFSHKYVSLGKPSLDRPCPTICASHGGASIAGIVHPTEKRKFSIAELRRICAFPDDFILTGSYQQQWERLGRAVPPVMMYHVAKRIERDILCKIK